MEKTIVNNISMAYDRCGKGKPLVLLHGYPLDHRTWDKVAPMLAPDFDLIIPDLRGFGQSEVVEHPYSISDMASDIAELLIHLGIGKAVVVGHSMGGYISLAFARSYPDRLLGLGLVASQVLADNPERKEGRYKTIEQIREFGVKIIAKTMSEKLTRDLQLQEYLCELIMEQPATGIVGALKALAERRDQTSLLDQLNVPLVLVHGDDDVLIPVERAIEINEVHTGTSISILPGVGHMPMLENVQETAKALMLFK